MNKKRLDIFMVENNLCNSRNQAAEIIKKGYIKVNNIIVLKPNKLVDKNDEIEFIDTWRYVSRAGYKLEKAINEFKINFQDKVILDIGSSTGGFVDCSLQHNAKFVYALDVGINQLDQSLLNNNKVLSLESTNLKDIPNLIFDKSIDIITCDVSFISLKNVFNAIINIVNKDTIIIVLIKPQFELDNKILKKCNYSISDQYHKLAINKVIEYANENNFKLMNLIQSPLLGAKKKNMEFLAYFKLDK